MLATLEKKEISVKDFNSTILNKGKFSQYVVSPYGSTESFYHEVLVISDKVTEPTWLIKRKSVLALILPLEKGGMVSTVTRYKHLLSKLTRVQATYFTVMDFNQRHTLFSVQS